MYAQCESTISGSTIPTAAEDGMAAEAQVALTDPVPSSTAAGTAGTAAGSPDATDPSPVVSELVASIIGAPPEKSGSNSKNEGTLPCITEVR